ncbi:MAG: glycosyltransferase family 39 protein [Acidimicrobiales bacterium]|nr:glycosyltransferase family 39 protein [Acidimicrobiales bacterium]
MRRQPGRAWLRTSWPLLAIAAVGLAIRLTVVLAVHPTCPFDIDDWTPATARQSAEKLAAQPQSDCFPVNGDALGVLIQGKLVAEGHGFAHPYLWFYTGEYRPAAGKPPLQTLIWAALHLLGLGTPTWFRVAASVGGSVAIVVIGHVAQQLAGRRAGILAASAAAAYPMLIISDWRMLNESFLGLFIALILAAAYRFWRRPSPGNAALMGAAIAIAAHLRTEAYQLLVFMAVPLTWSIWRASRQRRMKLLAVTWITAAAVALPWNVFISVTMDRSAFGATGIGSVLKNGSCDEAWFGDRLGFLDFACFDDAAVLAGQLSLGWVQTADESELDSVYRERALDYISANIGRLPIVVAARIGRIWDVYAPLQNAELNAYVEGRGLADSRAGLLVYWMLLPFAGYGVVTLWRRRIPISPLIAPAIAVTIVAAISYGLARYRLPADVALTVGAGVGVDALLRRRERQPPVGPVERLASYRPPRKAMRAEQRTLLAGGGVVASVLVAMVLAWSAGVEPAVTAIAKPDTRIQQLCDYAAAHGISGGNLSGLPLVGPGLNQTVADFEYLTDIAPEELQPQLVIVRDTLRRYAQSGLSGPDFLLGLTEDERKDLGAAIGYLLDYQEKHCAPTPATTGPS